MSTNLDAIAALARLDVEGRFTLDGEPTSLLGLVEANAEDGLDLADLQRMAAMQSGQRLLLGGGAGAEFILERVR